jgi:hypothetical protein
MSIISFIDDHEVIDRINGHLKLNFEAERPPPASSYPAGTPDSSRGKGGLFLRTSGAVFCPF